MINVDVEIFVQSISEFLFNGLICWHPPLTVSKKTSWFVRSLHCPFSISLVN